MPVLVVAVGVSLLLKPVLLGINQTAAEDATNIENACHIASFQRTGRGTVSHTVTQPASLHILHPRKQKIRVIHRSTLLCGLRLDTVIISRKRALRTVLFPDPYLFY